MKSSMGRNKGREGEKGRAGPGMLMSSGWDQAFQSGRLILDVKLPQRHGRKRETQRHRDKGAGLEIFIH